MAHDVAYVPDLRTSLLSLSFPRHKELTIVFRDDPGTPRKGPVEILSGQKIVAKGFERDFGLYEIMQETSISAETCDNGFYSKHWNSRTCHSR